LLRGHHRFVESYSPVDGDTLYAFKLSEDEQQKLVKPFVEGRYSKIDRDYVEKFFPNVPHHRLYGNRLVLDKSPRLKEAIEDELGVTLPDNAEVWSKPKLEYELYGYPKGNEIPEPQGG
jgi:hypothetical protein